MQDEAIGVWLALLRAGLEPGEPFERRYWDLAISSVVDGSTSRSLQERTSTARRMGLIEIQKGAGHKPGLVKLREPGHPDQLVPGVSPEQLEAWAQPADDLAAEA